MRLQPEQARLFPVFSTLSGGRSVVASLALPAGSRRAFSCVAYTHKHVVVPSSSCGVLSSCHHCGHCTARVVLRGSHRHRRRAPHSNTGTARYSALPTGALPLQGRTCVPSMLDPGTCLSLLWPSRPDAAVVVVVPATVQGGGGLALCATGAFSKSKYACCALHFT